jgi:hypothetical protein
VETGTPSREVEAGGMKMACDEYAPSTAEVENVCTSDFAHPHAFMVCTGTTVLGCGHLPYG